MNFSGKFVYYISYLLPAPQTHSFHSINTPLMMIVTMRGNVSHLTNEAVNQVDWRPLGQHVVSK